MYGQHQYRDVLISDPRKSAGKHALCVAVEKDFPMRQNRRFYPAGFYVKGKIDWFYVKMVRLIKRDDGSFLFPVPTDIREKMNKKAGDGVDLNIHKDRLYHGIHNDLMMVLFKEPEESIRFYVFLGDMEKHRFHQWVNTSRTDEVRDKRIGKMLNAMRNKQTFKEIKKR
jgi:hypothetical protein